MDEAYNELRLEQYKLLHQEVMSLVAETRKIEVLVIGGIGALYAWLAGQASYPSPVAYVGTALAIFGSVRALGLFRRISEIAVYMRGIEASWPTLFGNQDHTKGWETYLHRLQKDGKCFPLRWVALGVWAAVLFMSVVGPTLLEL